MMSTTPKLLQQAIKELSREELELYALGTAIMYDVACERLGEPNGIQAKDEFGLGLETRVKLRQVAAKVSERVRDLHVQCQ